MLKDPKIEHSNLALLKNAEHPNILEMVGSYTLGENQNMLFQEISGGNLKQLMKDDQAHEFRSSQDLWTALAGLASAIKTVHSLTSKKSNFIKNGFHHDLRPENILVDGKKFILSDFGLARFKDPDESSETTQKLVGDYYLAPECIDLLDTSKRCFVRRSSDIWSFGCIIAELLTYMLHGTKGVGDFKTARKYSINHHIRYDFHSGPNPNSGVQKWLSDLGNTATPSSYDMDSTALLHFVRLIKDILVQEPSKRPKAPVVEARLWLIALSAKMREIIGSYQKVRRSKLYDSSVEAFIEEARFQSLFQAIGLNNTSFEVDSELIENPATQSILVQSAKILQLLEQEKEALDDLTLSMESPASPPFIEVQRLNKRILESLDRSLQEQADAILKLKVLQEEKSDVLQDLQDVLEVDPNNEDLVSLITIRKLDIILRMENHQSQSLLDPKPELGPGDTGGKKIGRLTRPGHPTTRVIVEYKSYRNWQDRESEVHQRITAFVQLLSASAIPERLRTLRCLGYYHEPSEIAVGIVFEFPKSRSELRSTTLRQILDDDKIARGAKEPAERPSLRSRFRLACRLASSIYEVHSLRWLHKSISSFNVVLFTGPGPIKSTTQISQSIEQPYLMGFEHSRPDEEEAFSSKLPPQWQEYHHPDFINGTPYRVEFDYYSLGIILLELALWKSVSEITKSQSWKVPWAQFRERLIQETVPQLDFYVGPEYREVVGDCLRMRVHDRPNEGNSTVLIQNFQDKVVARLRELKV